MTDCECLPKEFPFYCVRHGCTKIERWYELCRTEPDCFQKWETGVGHGQVQPHGKSNPPSLANRVWNFAQSVATYVAGGCHSISAEEYAARLAVCETCPHRNENICLQCGCYLSVKARWRDMECPLDKWPPLTEGPRHGHESNGHPEATTVAPSPASSGRPADDVACQPSVKEF